MHILALEEIAPTLWRNGGGLTRLLAQGGSVSHPSAPHLDEAHWRISLADINADGPFSTFTGFDRHAVLLGDGTVELSGAGDGVTAYSLAPVAFPGEASLDARLHGAPVRFLNLMVRRDLLRGELRIADRDSLVDDALAWALLPVSGSWSLEGLGMLAPGQVAIGAAPERLHASPGDITARAVLALVTRH